ncbi:hypothetical protein C8R44DRAFT_876686 [Mycena epipterygia]|nr:hypothetical protein C8R44DRAFT_876686 [Mycena epipterygia]
MNTILSSPDPGFNCLAPAALNNVISLTITNASFDELTGAVDHWLTEMCGVGSCRRVPSSCAKTAALLTISQHSNDTINEILGNATAGGVAPPYLTPRTTYFTVANKFCTTESITLEGPLQVNATSSELALAYYQLSVKAGDATANIQTINTTCGADFTATLNDTVVGITQAAVNSEFKPNGASILAPTTCLLILVVSGFFALL